MVVPPRATERVWGTDTIAGAGAGAVEPGAGLPCTLLGSRPDARLTLRMATLTTPVGAVRRTEPGPMRVDCSESRESSPRGREMV